MAVYACSDLHGMYGLYQQIKNFLKPEDKVYCLGDCADRGPQGWRIITEVYNDPQWIYLKGNHEDMLAKAIITYYGNDYSRDYELLCCNGGDITYQDWGSSTQWDKDWGLKLISLPYKTEYNNTNGQKILLSHSGYNPRLEEERSKPYSEHDFIWNRNHIATSLWCGQENEYVVHGHTPVALARKGRNRPEYLRAETYCNGHKINIDCGAFFTGVACLLDLDTFEEYYFYDEPLKI